MAKTKGKTKNRKRSVKRPSSAPTPVEDKTWRARDDLRTLSQAEEIKQDPSRMTEVAKEGKRQIEALTKALRTHVAANPVKDMARGMGGKRMGRARGDMA